MQRRAAAIYFVVFVLVGAAAYGVIASTDAPHVSFEDAEAYSSGETVTLNERTYTVEEVKREESSGGGGHGGGGGEASIIGTLAWTNESAEFSASLEHNTTTTYQNETWMVHIANETNVTSFTLVEERNITGLLVADSAVENETVSYQGQPHVVFRDNDSLEPLNEYLGEPETQSFSVGDTYQYEGNATTVSSVTPQQATVEWMGSKTNRVELSEGGNFTAAGQQYFTHFPNENSVQLLATDERYDEYKHQQAEINYFHERMNGLWGITELSAIAAIILLSTAYLPVKD